MSASGSMPPPRLVLDDSEWSHKAWMSRIDTELFERVLLRKGQAAQGAFQVLEWGAGRSTLYFSRRLQELGLPYQWLSLDYDRGYVDREVAPQLVNRPEARLIYADDAKLEAAGSVAHPLQVVVFDRGRLQPFLGGHAADRHANLHDYVTYPARLGGRYDLIFVDGRKRRRCLLEAARLLKTDGVALLHDAYRPHYQCAFESFRSQRMLGEILWVGSQADTTFVDLIT